MKPAEISGPINSGANGAVILLLDAQAPSTPILPPSATRSAIHFCKASSSNCWSVRFHLRDQMEKSGKIKINQDEMKALTKTGSEEGM